VKIIAAKYIYKDSIYYEGMGVVFDKKIIKIGPLDTIQKEYPKVETTFYGGNSIIYPGFINAHTHLEFSANRAKLTFGSFIEWLYSVFAYREELIAALDRGLMQNGLDEMAKSGVTTIGAISSFGADMDVCKEAKQRIIYFNEVIGSNPATVDALFSDFNHRLNDSLALADDRFYPAVAIHAPYSVHPILIKAVLKLAKSKQLLTTAHFLESQAEKEWLQSNSGAFKELFEKYFNTTKAVNTIEGFLALFEQSPTLFTHATQANKEHFEYFNRYNHSVIHCPRSNRLLGCGRAKIEYANSLLLGTDGYSSNYSLSILEELKAALMLHHKANLKQLASKLIESVTTNASKALKLPIGEIKEGYFADFAIFKLAEDLKNSDKGTLALHTILDCQQTEATIVGGEII